jgi:hypothetical protein
MVGYPIGIGHDGTRVLILGLSKSGTQTALVESVSGL